MKIEKRGNTYTCRIYDKIQKRQVRFSAPSRKELMQKVGEYELIKESPANMSLEQAMNYYIRLKSPVLSPTTIRGYKSCMFRLSKYKDLPLTAFTDRFIQEIVGEWSVELSPKTVKNVFSFLNSVLLMQNINVSVSLPRLTKPQLHTPTDKEVHKLLDYFKGTEMYLILLFAIYIPLRRGEICSLKWTDIRDNKVHITKTMVYTGSDYIIKNSPKTNAGYRIVELPDVILKELKKYEHTTDRIFSINIAAVSRKFSKAVKKLNLEHMRFHDLRHYSASKMHALGIPDKYIIQRGGWETESVMKRIYQDTISEEEQRINKKINSDFF